MKPTYSPAMKAGLTAKEWKQYNDLLTKANNLQLERMRALLRGEVNSRINRAVNREAKQ